MKASKENAARCLTLLEQADRAKELVMLSEADAETLREFLTAAKAKLPTEASYRRDAKRRRKPATAGV